MTTEEKAKAYDEALEKAKKYMDEGYTVLMPDLFPQLHESEDEQTRKRLIDFISNIKRISESGRAVWAVRDGDVEMCNAFLSYLEKQKYHFRDDTKKVEKQDYSGLNDLERAIHRGFLSAGVENVPVTIIKETANECKRTQTIANENANAEWSEEYDEENLQTRFAFYTYKDDPSTLYLSNVFVEEASRNHGFGTRILRAAEKVAETIGATTISLKVKQDSPANA